MSSYPAIKLHDLFELLSVWEFNYNEWQLVKITRISEAITLSNTPNRLAFPLKVNPNKIAGFKLMVADEPSLCSDLNRLLNLINLKPGQNTLFLAKKLKLNSTLVNTYLSELEKNGQVHHKFNSCSKTRLYYPGLPQLKYSQLINFQH